MRRWFRVAWRVAETASVIHWLFATPPSIVGAIVTAILGYGAGLPTGALIASVLAVFLLVLLLGLVAIPLWDRRRLRGDLQNLAGALEYDLGYIRQSAKPPHVEVGRWPKIHKRLSEREGLEKAYRAIERAFQAINRYCGDTEQADTVLPTIEAALAEIEASLGRLSMVEAEGESIRAAS